MSMTAHIACFMFQSTPPHGERPTIGGVVVKGSDGFNPRPRTGSD